MMSEPEPRQNILKDRSILKRNKSLVERTKSFFGVDYNYTPDEIVEWNHRRLKFCVNKFGNINQDKLLPDKQHDQLSQSLFAGNYVDSSLLSPSRPLQTPDLDRTLVSLSSQGCLQRSLISPQVSTVIQPVPVRKPHAFKALAIAVTRTLSNQKRIQENVQMKNLGTITDDVEESVEPQFCSLKYSSYPSGDISSIRQTSSVSHGIKIPSVSKSMSRKSKGKRSLKWSQSVVERVHSGIKKMNVRRRFTDSLMGRIICCIPKYSENTKELVKMIDDLPQFRCFFTYWICVVQLIVFIASISVYGIAPVKMEFLTRDQQQVIMPSGTVEQVCREEYVNIFVGLRQADLIRLGGRYSPCMRQDKNLREAVIEEQKDLDRRSGCCNRNDGGGCYQTSQYLCSSTLATWNNVKTEPRINGSTTAMVCGLDPEFCDKPRSIYPFEWKSDVVSWPICEKQAERSQNGSMISGIHMQCEITGRPCCIGSKAECVVTTLQHCNFLRGYYHPEASLCSQVNCLNEICGMLSFYDPERPDQFYRLFTALFVNSSLGSLIITLCIQLTIMRDLEKMAGWHRISIVYFLSGIIGNLCSGVFLPYQVQTGASGSIFAIIGMTFTEFVQSWRMIESPWPVFFKYLGLGIFLFLLGFLPFFDNYAHMSGFLSGVVLSFVLLPFLGMPTTEALQKLIMTKIDPNLAYEKFRQTVKMKRLTIMICCSILWVIVVSILFLLFYWYPVTKCSWCKYFNCIPIAPHFCDNMDVNITSKTACVIRN